MTGSIPIVVLIGPPGAGKSEVGARVAAALGSPFVDTDRRIAAAHGPIPEIFATAGEVRFRELERAAVAEALEEPAVVALGGGAVLDPATRELLGTRRVALLTVSADAVAERIGGGRRPLLTAGGLDAWRTLAAERAPLYRRLAQRCWDTSTTPAATIAAEIADWVRGDR